MKLQLDEQDVKAIVLEWAETRWPKVFNTIDINVKYGFLDAVTLTHEDPPEPVQVAAVPAIEEPLS